MKGPFASKWLYRRMVCADNRHRGVSGVHALGLHDDELKSSIKISGTGITDEVRLRQLLEKFDLNLGGDGRLGLGSNNLLFMACELLLIEQEDEGNKMLLIEEPEAHLHPQRQLSVMKSLQQQAEETGIQIIITTHSPNLASAIKLDNLVIIQKGRAFSMAEGNTKLEPSDYRFLERFLDVTKANLFFARGVMIVEGDAENILLPTLASLIGRDFTERGVSILNVGGVGLRRYARIFQRKDIENVMQLDIPVACVTDMDVMPDCAPVIIGKVKDGETWPKKEKRRWYAKQDIGDSNALDMHRDNLDKKASGQCVETFVSDEWPLEYDLALGKKADGSYSGGLGKDVWIAACLAQKDDDINDGKTQITDVAKEACETFTKMKEDSKEKENCTVEEVLASHIYAKFAKDKVSKAIAAQYLAGRLHDKFKKSDLTADDLRTRLPKYLVAAIDYVTGGDEATITEPKNEESADE